MIKNNYLIYVACIENKVVGFIGIEVSYVFELPKQIMRVNALAVDKNYQNKGIGKHLIQEVEKYAKINNMAAITLNSGISRKTARIFYEKQGYKMNIELYDKIKNLYLKYHKEKTWNHVENVAKEAKKLAIQYHLDIEKCMIAALLHDISAILSPDDMYKYAKELGYQIDPSEEKYHFLLHQRISKEIAYDYFHIKDEDILSAIECHTTLKKEMNDYDKIIFLTDKLAWDQGGIPPYYQQLKEAINISLDKGCYWFISYQFETHQLLMPHTWLLEAYEKLKQTNEGK